MQIPNICLKPGMTSRLQIHPVCPTPIILQHTHYTAYCSTMTTCILYPINSAGHNLDFGLQCATLPTLQPYYMRMGVSLQTYKPQYRVPTVYPSLAAKGALAHRLQNPKWPTGSGKVSTLRCLGILSNFC